MSVPITLILAPSLIVGAITYLLKSIVNQGFTRDLERFKSDLQRESHEKRERFSLIHQKRAEIISRLYSNLAKTKSLLADLVGIFQSGGQSSLMEKKQKVADSYNETSQYFTKIGCFYLQKQQKKQNL